jgi:hypothetical protein
MESVRIYPQRASGLIRPVVPVKITPMRAPRDIAVTLPKLAMAVKSATRGWRLAAAYPGLSLPHYFSIRHSAFNIQHFIPTSLLA